MTIEPFKLRIDGEKALEIAVQMFGGPTSVSAGWNFKEMHWKKYEGRSEVELEIRHVGEMKNLAINLTVSDADEYSRPKETLRKLESFINYVKKPWEMWSEDEILEDPMWICLYREETGLASQAMLNKMTMESYLKPQDQWIKRFFGTVQVCGL